MPRRVAQIEAEILAAEGPYHVADRYYANPDDADRQRRWEAERRAERETLLAAIAARQQLAA